MNEPHATVLDIGANHGQFSLYLARKSPRVRVVAVEPIPSLAAELRSAAGALGLENHETHSVAIGGATRTDVLHVSSHGDNGVTSLLSLDTKSIETDEYWKNRPDLILDRDIRVEVITLESLLLDLDISVVDFIKIDAQGLDLEVLLSAGNALPHILSGMLEVPTSHHHRLYQAEAQDLRSVLNSLNELGFEVYSIKPNDPACNEVNVFFARPGVDPAEMEQRLGLRGLSIYDGKHFWASPSSTYEGFLRAERLIAESENHRVANRSLEAAIAVAQEEVHKLRVEQRKVDAIRDELQGELAKSGRAAASFRDMLLAEQHSNRLLTHRSRELGLIVHHLSNDNEVLRRAASAEPRSRSYSRSPGKGSGAHDRDS